MERGGTLTVKDRTQKAKKERFGWPLRGRIRSILLWYIRRLIFHAVFWWIIWCSSKVVDSLVCQLLFFSGLRWNFPSFLLLTYLSKYEWFFFSFFFFSNLLVISNFSSNQSQNLQLFRVAVVVINVTFVFVVFRLVESLFLFR